MRKIKAYKKHPVVIASWLLKLPKYIPGIQPRNKNEAIAYFHFLKLLNDMFTTNAIHINQSTYGFVLTHTRIENSYGGHGKYFERYLGLFFYRTHYFYQKNEFHSKTPRKFHFHSHIVKLLNRAFQSEYKPSNMLTVMYPESKGSYITKNAYLIPYQDLSHAIQITPDDEILMEHRIEVGISANYGTVTKDKIKKENFKINEILGDIKTQMTTGTIVFDTRHEIQKLTVKNDRQLRSLKKEAVIELATKPCNCKKIPTERNNEYEYVEDRTVVNIEAVKKLIDDSKVESSSLKQIYQISILNNILFAQKSGIPLVYRSKQKGLRLTNVSEGINPVLQSLPKQIRNVIFTGFYDYDISAAAPTIIYQYYRRYFPDENYRKKHVEAYIGDKKDYYRDVLTDLIIDIEQLDKKEAKKLAKKIFTGAMFGSVVLAGVSEMELSEELRQAMIDNEEIDGLIDNIDSIFKKMNFVLKKEREAVYEKDSLTTNGKTSRHIDYFAVQTPTGKILKFDKWDIKKVLSLIYQSIEREILDLVVQQHGEKIILRIHDGFIAKEELNIEELERLIKAQTGFDVKYELKVL